MVQINFVYGLFKEDTQFSDERWVLRKLSMNDYFSGKSVGIFYCEHDPHSIFVSEKDIDRIYSALDHNRVSIHKFFVWGHYDYLSMVYTDSPIELVKIAQIPQAYGPGVRNTKVEIGNVIYSSREFYQNLYKKSAQISLPIICACSIKCSVHFIRENNKNNIERLSICHFYRDLVESILSAQKSVMIDDNLMIQIIATYSHNDFILICQSNSVQTITKFITNIRKMPFDKPVNEDHHLFLYTNAVLGAPLETFNKQLKFEPIKMPYVTRLNEEKLSFEICLQIKPGHCATITDKLIAESTFIETENMGVSFGNYDLIIRPTFEITLSDFFEWYFNTFRQIIQKSGASAIKVKTVISQKYDIDHNSKSESANKFNPYSLRRYSEAIKKNDSVKLNDNIKNAIISLSTSIDYLIRQNSSLNADYSQISKSYELFLNKLVNDYEKFSTEPTQNYVWFEYSNRVCEVIYKFSRILTERFKSGQLYNMTQVEFPNLSYCGSFGKILNGMEFYGNIIIDEAVTQFINEFFSEEEQAEDSDVDDFICLQIYESISPKVERIINGSFILFPFSALLLQENWFYLFHELGHVVYNIITDRIKLGSFTHPNQKKLLSELFADYFSCRIVFKGEYKKYFHFFNYFAESKLIEKGTDDSILREVFLSALVNLSKHERTLTLSKEDEDKILSDIHYEREWILEIIDKLNSKGVIELIKFIDNIKFEQSNKFTLKIQTLVDAVYHDHIGRPSMNSHEIQSYRRQIISELWFENVRDAESYNRH